MTRPAPWKLSEILTLWLDVETGVGVDDSGTLFVRSLAGAGRSLHSLIC